MALSTETKRRLKKSLTSDKAGTEVAASLNRQGVAVANAAGANPTKAEFDALLTSLRNAGLIAT